MINLQQDLAAHNIPVIGSTANCLLLSLKDLHSPSAIIPVPSEQMVAAANGDVRNLHGKHRIYHYSDLCELSMRLIRIGLLLVEYLA